MRRLFPARANSAGVPGPSTGAGLPQRVRVREAGTRYAVNCGCLPGRAAGRLSSSLSPGCGYRVVVLLVVDTVRLHIEDEQPALGAIEELRDIENA